MLISFRNSHTRSWFSYPLHVSRFSNPIRCARYLCGYSLREMLENNILSESWRRNSTGRSFWSCCTYPSPRQPGTCWTTWAWNWSNRNKRYRSTRNNISLFLTRVNLAMCREISRENDSTVCSNSRSSHNHRGRWSTDFFPLLTLDSRLDTEYTVDKDCRGK